MTAVEARELTRRFDGFTAVDRVSFRIAAGEVWGFLGPNGAGKSTTIRMLIGALPPSEGTARVLGRDPEEAKGELGYMSQRFGLWGDLTVRENMEFYARVYGLSRARRRAEVGGWLARLELDERRDDLAGQLSTGLRQRLALGCSVLHAPRVLFLDEPTAGVDPLSRRRFWGWIREFAEGGAAIMVTTHHLDEAERCDRLAFLDRGRILVEGTPEEIRARPVGGLLVEVRTERVVEALRHVEGVPGVLEASLRGAALRVRVEGEEAARRLAERLGAEVRRVEPRLEDVFVAIVEGAR